MPRRLPKLPLTLERFVQQLRARVDPSRLANALAMLAADPVLRSQIGKRALQTIYERGLLWESNAQKVVELLQVEPSLVAYE